MSAWKRPWFLLYIGHPCHSYTGFNYEHALQQTRSLEVIHDVCYATHCQVVKLHWFANTALMLKQLAQKCEVPQQLLHHANLAQFPNLKCNFILKGNRSIFWGCFFAFCENSGNGVCTYACYHCIHFFAFCERTQVLVYVCLFRAALRGVFRPPLGFCKV